MKHVSSRHAPRHGLPWTAEEDRAILAATSDFRAGGARLGRTQGAVIYRRLVLRRSAQAERRA